MSRVLVTGGGRGIGRSICLRIAKEALARGESPRLLVTATGSSPDLAEVVRELEAMGAAAHAVSGDLNDPGVPAGLVAAALEFCGGLDAVVHNAGGAIAAPLVKVRLEDWDSVFAINCRAFFLIAQAANRALRESKGSLCAIGSSASETVQPYLGAYPPAKAALAMLVNQLAYEWGPHGIRVNCVSPGLTLSRSTEAALANEEDRARAGGHIPLRRVATPEEIAAVVAFVVGPDAGYLTGENINVDGGLRHIGSEAMLNDRPDAWAAQDASRLKPT
ncbi:MAG: SDR family oxidoreductase [Sphingomonadales bacterium]|nr:SDR family oxidoreductase [Sphingomonadales bacterium]